MMRIEDRPDGASGDRMNEKQIFRLVHLGARQLAAKCIAEAPDGYKVTVGPPSKTRDQEERYHAMVGDIAKQCEHIGRRWDSESWKRLLIDEFADEMRAAGTPLRDDCAGSVVPSLDGRRIVQLGIQSRRFLKKEASAFIEFLFAFGAAHAVRWSNENEEIAA